MKMIVLEDYTLRIHRLLIDELIWENNITLVILLNFIKILENIENNINKDKLLLLKYFQQIYLFGHDQS